MAEAEPGLPDSFLDSALDRIKRVENVFSHIARVIDLELVDRASNPDDMTRETRQKLHTLGQTLIARFDTGYALLADIRSKLGVPIDETPAVPTSIPKLTDDQSVTGTALRDVRRTPASPAGILQNREGAALEGVELYGAVVDAALVPHMDLHREGQTIEVAIVGKDKLKIGEHQIILKGHNLFIFNALLLLRDKPRSATELKALGFHPNAPNDLTRKTMFSRYMNNIINLLHQAAGIELVSKVGGKAKAARYCVNPNLVLVDQRTDEPESDEDENIDEIERPFVILVRRYGQHPQVQRALSSLKNGPRVTRPIRDTTRRYIQEIGQYDLRDDFGTQQALFADIEAGLDVFRHWQNGKDLTPEDEQALIKLVIAHQTVYLSNLRMVVNVAKQYLSFNMPLLDLIQEGSFGLTKAIARFEIERGFKFLTYAVFWIRKQITRAIANQSRIIRLPAHKHEKWLKLQSQINELERNLGRQATLQEIAEATGNKVKKVTDLLRVGHIILPSLNTRISASGEEFGDLLPDELRLYAEDRIVNRNVLRKEISNIFLNTGLSRQEQFVLSFRYGLDLPELRGTMVDGINYDDYAIYDHSLTTDEIGQIFGLTSKRIRKIEAKAMEKNRLHIINQGLVYAGFLDG